MKAAQSEGVEAKKATTKASWQGGLQGVRELARSGPKVGSVSLNMKNGKFEVDAPWCGRSDEMELVECAVVVLLMDGRC